MPGPKLFRTLIAHRQAALAVGGTTTVLVFGKYPSRPKFLAALVAAGLADDTDAALAAVAAGIAAAGIVSDAEHAARTLDAAAAAGVRTDLQPELPGVLYIAAMHDGGPVKVWGLPAAATGPAWAVEQRGETPYGLPVPYITGDLAAAHTDLDAQLPGGITVEYRNDQGLWLAVGVSGANEYWGYGTTQEAAERYMLGHLAANQPIETEPPVPA